MTTPVIDGQFDFYTQRITDLMPYDSILMSGCNYVNINPHWPVRTAQLDSCTSCSNCGRFRYYVCSIEQRLIQSA
jgi:hypothetical protein